MPIKQAFFKMTGKIFANLGAVLLLLILLIFPVFIAANLTRFEQQKALVLGTTDVLDYGNLVQIQTQVGATEVIKIKYSAFANQQTLYENVAYIKNQSDLAKRLTILAPADNLAELFFNIGKNTKPKTYTLAPGQLILASLQVAPSANFADEKREAEFVIVSY